MKVKDYLENPQSAVNQLFALGHFDLALYMQQTINKQQYKDFT